MLKVIFKEENIVDVSTLSDRHIIGVEFANGDKSKVIKLNDESYHVDVTASRNNYDSTVMCESIEDLLNYLRPNIINIYVFKKGDSLLKWMLDESIDDIITDDLD